MGIASWCGNVEAKGPVSGTIYTIIDSTLAGFAMDGAQWLA